MDTPQALQTLQQHFDQRIDLLEALIGSLAKSVSRRAPDPAYLSLDAAAALAGKSKGAIQKLLQRNRDSSKGLRVRQLRGAVHRQDFLNFLEETAKRKPGRGERIRQAAQI